jgi:hypothetical protein
MKVITENEGFKRAYIKYKKLYPLQNLPNYTSEIGVLFGNLLSNICTVSNDPKLPGTTWDQLGKDNYKIREFLKKRNVKSIIFSDAKGKPLKIDNEIIISVMIQHTFHNITSHPITEPKKPINNLKRFLMISATSIEKLKSLRITDELLIAFISNSVAFADHRGSTFINTDFTIEINQKASVIAIKSLEAFTKALQRIKT